MIAFLVEIGEEMGPKLRLRLGGRDDRRMRMAEHQGTGTEAIVDVLVARHVPETGTATTGKNEPTIVRQCVAAQGASRKQPIGVGQGIGFGLRHAVVAAELPTRPVGLLDA